MQRFKKKIKGGAEKFREKKALLLESAKLDPKQTKINFGVVNCATKSIINLEENLVSKILLVKSK